MRNLAAVSFAVLLSCTSLTAFAATSPEGAAEVKKQVEAAIAFPLDLAKSYGQGMKMSGAVEVTPKDTYYEVKMPGVQILAGGGFAFDAGTLVANVMQGEGAEAGALKVSISLPSTLRAMDPDGKPVGEVKIGEQKFSGLWWPDLAAFTQLDAKYKNIVMTGMPDTQLSGSIDEISGYVNLSKNGDDTWSGPYGVSGTGLKASLTGVFAADMTAASFRADSTYDKVNLKARKDMQDSFSRTLSQSATGGELTPDKAGAMMQDMMGSLSGFLDGMGSNVELSGVSFATKVDPRQPQPEGQPAPVPMTLSLSKAQIIFDVKGMLQDKGGASFQMKMEGLNTGETDPVISGIIPSNANVEVSVQDIPMKQLGATLSEALGGLMGVFGGMGTGQVDPAKQGELDQQTQMQMLTLMSTVPAQLAAAGTRIEVRNSYIDAKDFDANLDGAFKANSASPMMADGKLTLSLSGLDELVLKLQSVSQQPNANPKLAGYATMLSLLQTQTKPEAGGDGKSVRKLVLEVVPDGRILMNGSPLQLQGMPLTPPQ